MHFAFCALLLGIGAVADPIRGFNYGGTAVNEPATEDDFVKAFTKAKNLPGTNSQFTSARLFSTIQSGTESDPVSAIPAAIKTQTRLLLTLWASAGQDAFQQELDALKKGLDQYGQQFIDLIDGISVGSEDLYRASPTGIKNKSGAGASADEIVKYIQQTRDALNGHPDLQQKILHVDTWTVWVDGANAAVIDAVDFIGMDAYPFYETENDNTIDNAADLFFKGYNATVAVAKGKPVKVTETGWASQGPSFGKAIADVPSAAQYWHTVGCRLFGNIDTWWFTLDDTKADPNTLAFSILKPYFGDPLWDLTCPAS